MKSPYKEHLEERRDEEVIVHRASASDVKGMVHEIEEAGCVIKQPNVGDETAQYVFIAYEDIRGVGHTDHDYSQLD